MIASRGDHRESPQWVDLARALGALNVCLLERCQRQQLAHHGIHSSEDRRFPVFLRCGTMDRFGC